MRACWIFALMVVASTLAACGGSSPNTPGGLSLASSATGLQRSSPGPAPRSLARYAISLPVSSQGPTTCTVYEPDYATQIVVDSQILNVRTECELWSANQAGVGYLWGYEQASVTTGVIRLCTLWDPNRKMTASVIEDTGFVPISPAQRARGGSECAGIRASGWTDARRRLTRRRSPG